METPLDFQETQITSRAGVHTALVVSPQRAMPWGRARLEQMREAASASALDRQILDAVRTRNGRVKVLCIRGCNDDDSGHWRFDADLSDAETEDLGYLLVRSQVPTYRRLLACGVFALIHAEWGPREAIAFRHGSERLRDELRLGQSSRAKLALDVDPVATIDRWMLQHLTFFLTLAASKVLSEFLPEKLPLLAPRIPRIAPMVEALPPSSIA